ncbi:methylenetetrahydrofolate reductase [Campylobacter curvus]|uniref:methylenetetrahydrofolate reductase n=1 Tax=Campylobacter curvus TaxID=200 RepID=UPI0014706149|nr:methylenetetrahydrofolate reductase [Campylobacter curvus]
MLIQKIKNNEAGILLYGLTPPKENLTSEETAAIATKQIARLEGQNIDGIVLYDLQDESSRTNEERPFEFIKTTPPETYYETYLKKHFKAVIYKAVGKYSEVEFCEFLRHQQEDFITVFVGASSKSQEVKLKLDEAYALKAKFAPNITLGGICIPERHASKLDEHLKVAHKSEKGCEFFITQAVYNLENAKKFIDDYAKLEGKKCPIIFTFTPCGSAKTLLFMKWLGINIPPNFEERLNASENILQTSLNLCLEIFNFLYKYGLAKGISVGANVESVSNRKVEIEASITLLKQIREIIAKTNTAYHWIGAGV